MATTKTVAAKKNEDFEVTRESMKERAKKLVALKSKNKLSVGDLVNFILQDLREMGLPKTHKKMKEVLSGFTPSKISSSKEEKTSKSSKSSKGKSEKAEKAKDGKPFKFVNKSTGTVISIADGYYIVKGSGRGRPRKIHKDFVKKVGNGYVEKKVA